MVHILSRNSLPASTLAQPHALPGSRLPFPFVDLPLEIVEHEIGPHLDDPSLFALSLVDKRHYFGLKASPYIYSDDFLEYSAGKGNYKTFLPWVFSYFGYWEEPIRAHHFILSLALQWQNVEIAVWVISRMKSADFETAALRAAAPNLRNKVLFEELRIMLRAWESLPVSVAQVPTPTQEKELRDCLDRYFELRTGWAASLRHGCDTSDIQHFYGVLEDAIEVGDLEKTRGLAFAPLTLHAEAKIISYVFTSLCHSKDPLFKELAAEFLRSTGSETILHANTAIRSGLPLAYLVELTSKFSDHLAKDWLLSSLGSSFPIIVRHFFQILIGDYPDLLLDFNVLMGLLRVPDLIREFRRELVKHFGVHAPDRYLLEYLICFAPGESLKLVSDLTKLDWNRVEMPLGVVLPSPARFLTSIAQPTSLFLKYLVINLASEGYAKNLKELLPISTDDRWLRFAWKRAALNGKIGMMALLERITGRPCKYRDFIAILHENLRDRNFVTASVVLEHFKRLQSKRFQFRSRKFVNHFAQIADPRQMDWLKANGFEIDSSCYMSLLTFAKNKAIAWRGKGTYLDISHLKIFQWLVQNGIPLPVERQDLASWLKKCPEYPTLLSEETKRFFEGQ